VSAGTTETLVRDVCNRCVSHHFMKHTLAQVCGGARRRRVPSWVTVLTTSGPVTNMYDVSFTMNVKSVIAGEYTAPPDLHAHNGG
jgi:ribosomal protein L37E